MRVAVLGATGFVGNALVKFFVERGDEVVPLRRPNFDLTDPGTFTSIPNACDVLIHAAGAVGDNAPYVRKVNFESAYYLSRYLNEQTGIPLFVYLSTGGVYGMRSEIKLTCNSRLHPEGPYAISKLLAEEVFSSTLAGRKCVRLRLFFPFGPGQQSTRLIPGLIARVAAGETVTLNTGDGRPLINPIHIDALAKQIAQIIEAPERDCYNLGGATAVSIREIAELIGTRLNTKVNFSVQAKDTGNLHCEPEFQDETDFEEALFEVVSSIVPQPKKLEESYIG
jgi:nucleoside-diphosphate-sugar epimerase